jgi:hypothetical protein
MRVDDVKLSLSMYALVLVLVVAYGVLNLFDPCSWLMWEPLQNLPARCLPVPR